jgi:hypothetical protein
MASTPIVRKRGRGPELEESNKRIKRIQRPYRDPYTTLSEVTKAIIAQTGARRSKLELAVELLQEEYTDKLSDEHMQMALDLMETLTKATIFTSFRVVAGEPYKIRDCWLERHAGIQVIRAED